MLRYGGPERFWANCAFGGKRSPKKDSRALSRNMRSQHMEHNAKPELTTSPPAPQPYPDSGIKLWRLTMTGNAYRLRPQATAEAHAH